jgi:hypothetical protein
MEGIAMVKRSFIVSLFLLASSSALACNPAQGTGQCGFQGADGIYGSALDAQESYNRQQGGGGYYDPSRIPLPPIVITLPDKFGAIVIGETTFASTYNMNSKKEARQKALRECQPGKKQPCVIYAEYSNSCVSLAQGRDMKKQRSYFVAEFSDNRGQAYRKAMDKCSTKYSDCTIVIEEECSIAEPPR